MNGPEDTPTLAYAGVPNFALTPPLAVVPVSPEAARAAVPLKPEAARVVDERAARLIDTLATGDPQGPAFQAALRDCAAVGRDEIARAAGVMQGRALQCCVIGADGSAVDRAIAEIRAQLDPLHPERDGQRLAPQKLFGVIPLGSGLKAHLRRIESAGIQLQTSIVKLHAARDAVAHDIAGVEAARGRLWSAMQGLAACARLAASLDEGLSERLSSWQADDAPRARLVDRLLFLLRQGLAGILARQVACVNGYLALDALKKAGRELMNGCSRVDSTLGALILETSRTPDLDAGTLDELFTHVYKAMDAMDDFRAQSVPVLARNAEIAGA